MTIQSVHVLIVHDEKKLEMSRSDALDYIFKHVQSGEVNRIRVHASNVNSLSEKPLTQVLIEMVK